jgi:RimJ/RimL family protein N-acetyltransferase
MAANVRRYGDTRGPEETRALPPEYDWQTTLPSLADGHVIVRGLQDTDAPSLFALCADEPVGRFLWTPPSTMQRFEQFIDWTREQQSTGRQICFAIVPSDSPAAAGLIQVRQIDPQFTTAEWGFVIAERYWGTGLFVAAARLVVSFLFETVAVHRLEARTVVTNGRANGALEKLGAIKEGRLRKAFRSGDRCFDQYLWAMLAEDWISAGIKYQDSGIRAGLGISAAGIRKQA